MGLIPRSRSPRRLVAPLTVPHVRNTSVEVEHPVAPTALVMPILPPATITVAPAEPHYHDPILIAGRKDY